MRWVAPTEKDTANQTLEKRLWAAADQFRRIRDRMARLMKSRTAGVRVRCRELVCRCQI